jgi:hypothetical protein
MTEYNALTIERKDDPGVFEFYVNKLHRVGGEVFAMRGVFQAIKMHARSRSGIAPAK